jgi:hypothetical protein
MSIEALWALQFTGFNVGGGQIRAAKSGGVIVIETNRIFGGDSWQFYTGSYERDSKTGKLTVRIQTGVHSTDGGSSIFGGPPQVQVLTGVIQVSSDQQTATATLTVEGSPHMSIYANLTRVAELPNP